MVCILILCNKLRIALSVRKFCQCLGSQKVSSLRTAESMASVQTYPLLHHGLAYETRAHNVMHIPYIQKFSFLKHKSLCRVTRTKAFHAERL